MHARISLHVGVVAGCLALLVGTVPLPAAEVIVDNTDAGFTTLSGTWSTGTTASGKYGTNYRYATTANPATAEAQWQPSIPTAGDYQVYVRYPAGSNRITNVQYWVYYNGGNQSVTVDQTANTGVWVSIGTFNFAAGSSTNGRVTITNLSTQSSKRVYADAVRFFKPEPVTLTMAVSPSGGGTTTPAVGGPYAYTQNDVANITAMAGAGYAFDHWTVSAGAAVTNPASATTTVTMDASKTVTAVFTQASPQLRAHWADAFHEGFKSKTEIDNIILRTVAGRYNAIVAEVCAYHDNAGASHGAYWNSSIVPKAPDITATGLLDGDPLLYLIQQAHANGIEVHCWLVAFRVSSAWPPAGNSYLASHPEFLTVPLANMGGGAAAVGGVFTFDPGSPEVQDYLMSVVRELVTNYEIDGINWDYIRYTQTDAGYPANNTYANSGLKRFQRITGRTDTPAATGDTQWNDFRRQTITEVARRTRAEVASITSNPRQPVRVTCDLITTGNVTSSDFTVSAPYVNYLSNWGFWLQQGYLDGGMPMCYDREYNVSQAQWYRNWVNACIGWRAQRHMYIGQANYLNTMADSITQMQYAYSAGANGTVNYSYYSTVDSNMDGVTENDWTWYNYVAANLFTSPAPLPSMPWRNPATATEGSLWGRVTKAGVPVDDATVQVGALPSIKTDGAGYYVVTLIPAATGSSTTYNLTATKGVDSAMHTGVQVFAGDIRREDVPLGAAGPTITQQPQSQRICPGTTATFTVAATGSGTLTYQWQKNSSNLGDGGHYSGAATTTLNVSSADASDVADYRCVVTDSGGSTNSNTAALTLKVLTSITQQPLARSVCPGSGGTAPFTVSAVGDGTVTYQWQRNQVNFSDGGHYSGATTATLTVSSADSGDAADYRCIATAGCGSAISDAVALTVKIIITADFDRNCAVDQADAVIFQGCATSPNLPYDPMSLPPACTLTPDGNGRIAADFDQDGDVDQSDFGVFQRCYSDAGPVDANCVN